VKVIKFPFKKLVKVIKFPFKKLVKVIKFPFKKLLIEKSVVLLMPQGDISCGFTK